MQQGEDGVENRSFDIKHEFLYNKIIDRGLIEKKERKYKMKLNKTLFNLIAEIEFLIGSECYNPNAYDGWAEVEGREFRYPVNIKDQNGKIVKIRTKINSTALLSEEDITTEAIKYMKYKFGTNELFVGLSIIHILEFLENRYGFDFNELENQYKPN